MTAFELPNKKTCLIGDNKYAWTSLLKTLWHAFTNFRYARKELEIEIKLPMSPSHTIDDLAGMKEEIKRSSEVNGFFSNKNFEERIPNHSSSNIYTVSYHEKAESKPKARIFRRLNDNQPVEILTVT